MSNAPFERVNYPASANVLRSQMERSVLPYFRMDLKRLARAATDLDAYEALETLEGRLLGFAERVRAIRTNVAYSVLEGPRTKATDTKRKRAK